MTPLEHAAMTIKMQNEIDRRREAAKTLVPLSVKVEELRAIKALTKDLRQHKLNFYELTNGER